MRYVSRFLLFIASVYCLLAGCSSGGGSVGVTGTFAVVNKTPSAIATGVSTGSNVNVTFEVPINSSSVNNATFSVRGPAGAIAGTFFPDADENEMDFVPLLPLPPLTTVTVTLSTGITDVNGRHLDKDVSWSFTTGNSMLNRPVTDVVPGSLFGMHIHRATTTTPWPAVPFATWRLWDSGVAWPNLEPTKGVWDFTTLDKLVALAELHNVQPLLPLGLSPAWASARPNEPSIYKPGNAAEPANIDDWRTYVTMVATRYKGRINHYEIWNEPNISSFYTGTLDQMVTLAREAYQIIKVIDPAAVVLSPSATNKSSGFAWFDDYFSKGGGNFADAIGYHFYVSPNPPESIFPLVNRLKEITTEYGVSTKPLWNTESGWSNPKIFTTDAEAAAYVARAYLLGWASGGDRFYWYAWDNRVFSTLYLTLPDNLTLTPAAIAYGEVQKWLVGARVTSTETTPDNTWIFLLNRDGGYVARIVWNPDKAETFAIPASWGVLQTRNLSGTKVVLSGATQVQIGPSPLLLENTIN